MGKAEPEGRRVLVTSRAAEELGLGAQRGLPGAGTLKNEQEFTRYRNKGREVTLERGTSMGKGVACAGNTSRACPIAIGKCISKENTLAVSSCSGRKQKDPSIHLGVPGRKQSPGMCTACQVKMEFGSV